VQTTFPLPLEIKLVYRFLREYCDRHFPLVPYRHLLTTPQELDDVHGEMDSARKRFGPVVEVRAFAVPEMVMQPLSKFGLETQRNVDLLISVPHLQDTGLVTVSPDFEVQEVGAIGDRFIYHGLEYEVQTFKPAARWANTDLILYYGLHAQLYRPEASHYVTP
jgi:hypothetical protein